MKGALSEDAAPAATAAAATAVVAATRERERVLVLVLVYFRAHEDGAGTPTRYNELHLNSSLRNRRPKLSLIHI